MKHDFTELVFILDKSGSMAGLEKETIAGFNDMLAKQFVIITDGLENSSRDFSAVDIRQAIEHRTSQHGWEFIFLGANMDAVTTAVDLGIARNRAQSFHADKAGVSMNFRALGETTVDFRHKASVKEDWNSTIDEDYKERGKKQ